MKIATLGPTGTCSGEVASSYVADLGLHEDALELCDTYEEAVQRVLAGTVDRVIVPAAYMNFHKIVFQNIDQLKVSEILFSQTPTFVLAIKRGHLVDELDRTPRKVASHHAPSPLIDKLNLVTERVDASSNARAAWMVSKGEADLCITQSKALEAVNRVATAEGQLEIVETFGPVDMIWAVFERGASARGFSYWRACLPK